MDKKKAPPAGYKEVTEKSVLPIYAVGLVLLVYSLCFPLYRISDFLIAAGAAALTYALLSAMLPKKVVYKPCEPAKTGSADADSMLKEGREILAGISRANDRIPGEGISKKIFRIEDACKKIFAHVEKYPEKEKMLRTFMNYYLPTALKLSNTYAEFYEIGAEGENIKLSMERIENILDKMGGAFEAQLDSMYSDRAMDINADITVLDGMLKSQGLI